MVNHRRGPWSQHEDSWLISLVHRNGPHNWVRISQEISTRSPKQCRERYHQNLKPSLNHDPITPDEGEQIERMVHEMGKRWAEIARRLKGRSDNAVKNWWNGGQNRRKRNPERGDHCDHDQMQAGYLYRRHVHHYEDDAPPHMQHSLPPPLSRESEYYSQSRRPSLNPSLDSPRTLKLPRPHSYEPSMGSRPHPLELQPFSLHAGGHGRAYETPMPSPSGFSIVSADGAPSLITDTGSESRSPRGAASPLDITRAPLVGGREERKNSCTRLLPRPSFAMEDDDHSAAVDPFRRRSSFQLPAPQRAEPSTPLFREPLYRPSEYRPQVPQLLTQPASQLVQTHAHPLSAPLPAGQQPLPSFRNLAEPRLPPATTPTFRQLPSPFARPGQTSESKSAPVSPNHEGRDSRMNLSSIL